MNKDFLKRENCNKAKCKTCMFNYNEQSVKLSPERMQEIMNYLTTLQSSHVCHTTNKTCYGGLEVQAESMFRLGIIPEPKVDTMLTIAERLLFNKSNK